MRYREVDVYGEPILFQEDPADYLSWIEARNCYNADFGIVKRFAGPQVTCIDAGAWIGALSLYAAAVGYKRVLAIEPDPVSFDILTANVRLNGGSVETWNGALMAEPGVCNLGGVMGSSCARVTCADNPVKVPCVTLRQFVERANVAGPLFIKMDVEGAEAQILRDPSFFAQLKPDLYLSTHLVWWKEQGSDGAEEFAIIDRVARLYKHAVHASDLTPIRFGRPYGDVLFTDKTL